MPKISPRVPADEKINIARRGSIGPPKFSTRPSCMSGGLTNCWEMYITAKALGTNLR